MFDICQQQGGNTGGVGCDKKRGIPQKFVAGEREFTPAERADEATFAAAIKSAINQNEGTPGKLYPFPVIGEISETTEAATKGNLTLGPPRELRKGKFGYDLLVEVGQTEFQNLLQWHGRKVRLTSFDHQQLAWQEYLANGNSRGEYALIEINGNGFEDGNSAQTGVCRITITFLDTESFQKRAKYFQFNSLIPSDLQGLKDVFIVEPSAHVSNVHTVQLKLNTASMGFDGNILTASNGAAIAALAFTSGTGAGFATPLTTTSKTYDAATNSIKFTYDSTAYTALGAGAKIKLNPPSVAVLTAAGFEGIEIRPLIMTT